MVEFKKPKREIVADRDYIETLLDARLVKDLHDDEEICPWCHGTGLVIEDNPYGLSDDPNKMLGRFPYKHQSITFCQHCYNGVVHRCKLCGEIMPKGRLKHDCDAQKEIDFKKEKEKEAAKFRDAPVMSDCDAEKLDCFQSDDYPYNDGFFYSWDEFFDAYYDDNERIFGGRPEYVWSTVCEEFRMSAYDIVERETEDLYEDAFDRVSNDKIQELQCFLDEWCAGSGVGKTYHIGRKKVRIPWEKY